MSTCIKICNFKDFYQVLPFLLKRLISVLRSSISLAKKFFNSSKFSCSLSKSFLLSSFSSFFFKIIVFLFYFLNKITNNCLFVESSFLFNFICNSPKFVIRDIILVFSFFASNNFFFVSIREIFAISTYFFILLI